MFQKREQLPYEIFWGIFWGLLAILNQDGAQIRITKQLEMRRLAGVLAKEVALRLELGVANLELQLRIEARRQELLARTALAILTPALVQDCNSQKPLSLPSHVCNHA